MATLYIAEFANIAGIGTQDPPIVGLPPLAEQIVAISGSTTASAAFGANTRIIRLCADSVCSVKVGPPTPSAAATNMRLAANVPEYFGVTPGYEIAVIANT